MRILQGIHDNLRFLTAEVGSQDSNLQRYFETGSVSIAHRILDQSLAQAMFLRSRYLIELVLASDPKQASGFRVPVKEIVVG